MSLDYAPKRKIAQIHESRQSPYGVMQKRAGGSSAKTERDH